MPKTFRTIVVCHTNDFHPDKNDKIKGWVERRGGKAVTEFSDEVTHYIVSPKVWHTWPPDHPVRVARRKRTVYILKYAWLEDSLMSNKTVREETLEEYAWEVVHAWKVSRRRKQQRSNEAIAKRKKTIASNIRTDRCDTLCEAKPVSRKDGPLSNGAEHCSARLDVKGQATMTCKFQIIDECASRFDKARRDLNDEMALAGYRPYIDSTGFAYSILLVREDISNTIEERIRLTARAKHRYQYHSKKYSWDDDLVQPVGSHRKHEQVLRKSGRFRVNNFTTVAHYFDDQECCQDLIRPTWDLGEENLSDEPSSPAPEHNMNRLQYSLAANCPPSRMYPVKEAASVTEPCLRHWPEHLPFSFDPVMSYDSSLHLHRVDLPRCRVHIPRPFAYSLQIYELHSSPSAALNPTRASSDRTSVEVASPMPILPSSVPTITPPLTPPALSPVKKSFDTSLEPAYATVLLYTRKGRNCRERADLAPLGSTFDFAYRSFCQTVRCKTGYNWKPPQTSATMNNPSGHPSPVGTGAKPSLNL